MKQTNWKQRALAGLLALVLCFAFAPLSSFAAEEYDTQGATVFLFSDGGISVNKGNYEGYQISGTALTISEGGTYVLSGSCADGSVTVKKGTKGVTLVLEGISLTSADTAPLCFNKSTEVTVVVASGTQNTLSDSEKNNDDTYPENERAENAVLKCKDGSAVTLCGGGALSLSANGKNGIKSGASTEEEGEASLTIRQLTLNITAQVNDAINAEQLLQIESGTLNITAADDAIHCDRVMQIGAKETAGPTIDITQCYEGLEAAELNILSGKISVVSTDDCLNAANSDLSDYAFSMHISGGTITAYSSDGDGFDSNGTLTISGGAVTVFTANTADNEPLDADGAISISGGVVLAAGGSSGMGTQLAAEQPCVIFGSSFGGFSGMPGGQMPTGTAPNGEAPSGGAQPPQMPEGSGGESDQQTPQMPSGENGTEQSGKENNSAKRQDMPGGQGGQTFGGSTLVQKGETLGIADASGTVLCSAEAPCNLSYVLFSAATLNEQESYTLSANGTSAAQAQAQSGSVSGGTGQGTRPDGQPGSTTDSGQSDSDTAEPTEQTGSKALDFRRTWWLFALCILGGAAVASLCAVLIFKKKAAK